MEDLPAGGSDLSVKSELSRALWTRASTVGLTGPAHPDGMQEYAFDARHIPQDVLDDPDRLRRWVIINEHGRTIGFAADVIMSEMVTI